jgi:hypothetical protein
MRRQMRKLSPSPDGAAIQVEFKLAMKLEFRHCPKCDEYLPSSTFTRRANGRWSSYCKPCMSLYCRQHYAANAAKHNARRSVARQRYRVRNRAYVLDYLKTHPCVDCGESDLNVLELDHVDREQKLEEVSLLSRRGRSLAQLKMEIERCEVRCVNCHRRRTARQFGWVKRISPLPGCSSDGRALRLGRRGQEFEPLHSDQIPRSSACGLTDKASAF